MPDWCTNALTVAGDPTEIQRFLDFAQGTGKYDDKSQVLDFHKFIPYPEEFLKLDRIAEEYDKQHGRQYASGRPDDGYNRGGSDWCCLRWGTKMNAVCPYLEGDPKDGTVMIKFDTAYDPPIPVMEVASELFPELGFRLSYDKEGSYEIGTWVFEAGYGTCEERGIRYPSDEEEDDEDGKHED